MLSFLLFYLPSVLAIFNHNHESTGWIIMSVVMATFYSAVFCINYFWLVPSMLIRSDRRTLYFFLNIVLILSICVVIELWFQTHIGPRGPRHMRRPEEVTMSFYLMQWLKFVMRDGVMMVLAAGLAYALRLSQERENVRRRELTLNAERRQIELMSLKAQLNPHFLFNSLNNIYALIGFAPERAQSALHDLSSMLRFMIYDSANPSVPLSKELHFISEYVELMKLRLNSGVKLTCNISDNHDSSLWIAPLIFLTLVENAFKHSGPSEKGNFINIRIESEAEDLVCEVENTFQDRKDVNSIHGSDEESGVGLSNIKRQLNLIYPSHHSLSITKENGVFNTRLSISLSALKTADNSGAKTLSTSE